MKQQFKLMRLFMASLFLVSASLVNAQNKGPSPKKPLVVSLFNLGTQLPGSGVLGVFTLPVHPGLSVGTEFRYNNSRKNLLFQTAKFAIAYHQYVQTSIQLYSEAGFRHRIWRGSTAELRLGAGYLHAIAATEVFKAKDGTYAKKANWGRPQFMASTALGLSYQVQKGQNMPRFFLDYQFFLQMPFVKSYVPLAPATVLHAGVAIPFFKW